MYILKIIVIIVLVFTIFYTITSVNKQVSKVKSDIDDKLYTVRDLKDKTRAANMLARIKQNLLT